MSTHKGFQKNTRLLLSLAGLVALLALSLLWTRQKERTPLWRSFPGVDTTQIVHLEIASRHDTVRLMRGSRGQGWQVNAQYAVNDALLKSLWEVLQRSTRTQALRTAQYDQVQTQLQEEGYVVHVVHADDTEAAFRLVGHVLSNKSYVQVASEEAIWGAQLRGYDLQVADVFAFSAEQWRHRLLFRSTPYTLERLELRYPKAPEDQVSIRLTEKGPVVEGIERLDTTALSNYLDHFRVFYTNEYIREGQVPLYDSLMQTPPWASLALHDVNEDFSRTLWVFGSSEQVYYLLKDMQGSYSLCERQRLDALLIKKRDLRYTPSEK